MLTTATAGMVSEAWSDLDRATAGLSSDDAERRIGAASPNFHIDEIAAARNAIGQRLGDYPGVLEACVYQ